MRKARILNSATNLGASDRGSVVVCGSHGGLYPAYLAAKAGVRAIIFSDAGFGLDDGGVAGLLKLDEVGIAAAAVSVGSARIGNGGDMITRGVISMVNESASALGCSVGMACADAAKCLEAAETGAAVVMNYPEKRTLLRSSPVEVWALDSIAMVESTDAGSIVISGSHGGLIGPVRTAVKVDVAAAFYHDAGGGIDDAGFSRLPALDSLGIIGLTVDAASARIGDAISIWETGRISRCNKRATILGVLEGMDVQAAVDRIVGKDRSWRDR